MNGTPHSASAGWVRLAEEEKDDRDVRRAQVGGKVLITALQAFLDSTVFRSEDCDAWVEVSEGGFQLQSSIRVLQ